MSHVVLLYPKTGSDRPQDQIMPLSLLYVAAPLVREGIAVSIVDQRLSPAWREDLRRALATPGTVCAGISSMTGRQIQNGLELAQAVRELAPQLPIVWGGVHPSLLPEQTAESPLVDIVVAGEGENTFCALVKKLSAGEDWRDLAGLCFKDGGRIVLNPPAPPVDLDTLPPLPYDLLDVDRYRVSPLRTAATSLPIITSRGCSFRCGYCYNIKFHARRWRGLPPAIVLEHARRLAVEYKAGGLFLLDDNFFGNRKRAEEILRGLIASGLNLRLFNANARVDFLRASSPEFLALMREAGIEQIFVGVESGSDRVLEHIAKDIKATYVLDVNRKLKAAGILPVYSFMAGIPDETREDVEKTLALMAQLKEENPQAKLYKVCLYLPMPGTPLYEYCLKTGKAVLPTRLEGWAAYDYDHVNLPYISAEHRRFLESISEISGFLDVAGKVSGVFGVAAGLYSNIATLRCKNGWFGWMPEVPFIRLARGR